MENQPTSSPILLRFRKGDGSSSIADLRGQLSAVVQVDNSLLLGADEGTTIERLRPVDDTTYGEHTSFPLGSLIDLPDTPDEEIDIEGLAESGGCLWVVGSHSAKRAKVKADDDAKTKVERIAKVTRKGNRFLLARIPLVADDEGVRPDPSRPAARLRGGKRRNDLTRRLLRDQHLADFVNIPGKDNGFDVEGIAVRGNRVFLGLRGPVLRGHAVILDLNIVQDPDRADRLRLGRFGVDGPRYRKYFLDLNGLGVRDLCIDDNDLLILAGPTMTLDGDAFVFRWKDALSAAEDAVIAKEQLSLELELAYGVGDEGTHHPEGISLFQSPGINGNALLVVYDSPRASALQSADEVTADLFPLRP